MSRPSRSRELRYITRMDYARTRGWWVRFYSGTTLLAGKLFSDGQYGGKRKARVAAQAWRDANESTWVPPRTETITYVTRNRRNVTGAVGVALRIVPTRKGQARFSWCALWSEEGKQRTRSFGVATYGYQRSYQLALDFRRDRLGLPRIEKRPPSLNSILANRTF